MATHQPIESLLKDHTGQVTSIGFSPDGKMFAAGDSEKTILLWNVAKREPVRRLSKHSLGVTNIAFSPDGKLLASGSRCLILPHVVTPEFLLGFNRRYALD